MSCYTIGYQISKFLKNKIGKNNFKIKYSDCGQLIEIDFKNVHHLKEPQDFKDIRIKFEKYMKKYTKQDYCERYDDHSTYESSSNYRYKSGLSLDLAKSNYGLCSFIVEYSENSLNIAHVIEDYLDTKEKIDELLPKICEQCASYVIKHANFIEK